MRTSIILMAMSLLVFFVASIGSASLDQFSGNWINVDPDAGITKIDITVYELSVSVHGWGACVPTDCDWGSVDAIVFAPDVSSELASTAKALLAVYDFGFKETTLAIWPSGDSLKVESYNRFKEGDGRTNYMSVDYFRRNDSSSGFVPVTRMTLARLPMTGIPSTQIVK